MHTAVTVIVPTRNEAHNMPAFLASLPEDVGLIVVDSSDDDTRELIAASRPRNTRILHRNVGVTEARQIGAEAAKSDWLLFTDADITFAPNYFQTLKPYLQSPSELIYGPKLSSDAYSRYYRFVTAGQRLSQRLGIPAASGSNLLIRRYAFSLCGGFDLALSCNEDSEIAWRIRSHGYRTQFADDLVVYARDHRRIEKQGQLGKTLHSVVRCSLLFTGLMPERWRESDWGYWSESPSA